MAEEENVFRAFGLTAAVQSSIWYPSTYPSVFHPSIHLTNRPSIHPVNHSPVHPTIHLLIHPWRLKSGRRFTYSINTNHAVDSFVYFYKISPHITLKLETSTASQAVTDPEAISVSHQPLQCREIRVDEI